MSQGFWGKLQKPIMALAPMADVTDAAFRRLIANYSGFKNPEGNEKGFSHVMYTEFVSADGLFSPGRDVLMKDLLFSETERPIVAQFFTARPELMEKAVHSAVPVKITPEQLPVVGSGETRFAHIDQEQMFLQFLQKETAGQWTALHSTGGILNEACPPVDSGNVVLVARGNVDGLGLDPLGVFDQGSAIGKPLPFQSGECGSGGNRESRGASGSCACGGGKVGNHLAPRQRIEGTDQASHQFLEGSVVPSNGVRGSPRRLHALIPGDPTDPPTRAQLQRDLCLEIDGQIDRVAGLNEEIERRNIQSSARKVDAGWCRGVDHCPSISSGDSKVR